MIRFELLGVFLNGNNIIGTSSLGFFPTEDSANEERINVLNKSSMFDDIRVIEWID